MRFFAESGNNPDREFLAIVDQIVAAVLADSDASELFLIEVENWFDKKWRQYSGKNLVPRWRKETTIPAFVPSRILSEHHWLRTNQDQLVPDDHPTSIHPRERQPSRLNIHRKIADISKSAVFAWYSSNAEKNRSASLMIYTSKGDSVDTWYAGFRKNSGWHVQATVGISRMVVERLASQNLASFPSARH